MRNAANIIGGAITRFKEAGLSDEAALLLVLRAGDAALGCDPSWGSSGAATLPSDKTFLKAAAAGLASAASASSGRDMITDIFSDDSPKEKIRQQKEVPSKEMVPAAKPDPVAALMGAAGFKRAERAFLKPWEAMLSPLVAPEGVAPWKSVLLGAGLGATVGAGTNIASRVMNRNDPDNKPRSLIGDALKGGLIGGGISLGTNTLNKMDLDRVREEEKRDAASMMTAPTKSDLETPGTQYAGSRPIA